MSAFRMCDKISAFALIADSSRSIWRFILG